VVGVGSADAKPTTFNSYYWTSHSEEEADGMGCLTGIISELSGEKATVLLDFGGQLSSLEGTKPIFGSEDFTNKEIQELSYAFAQGYYVCDAESGITGYLLLGIGTNNDLTATKAAGETWASNVRAVANRVLEDPSMTEAVSIAGGSDLETNYSDGSDAYAWAKAYNESTSSLYIDYGDAGGCPQHTHNNGACPTEHEGWDQNLEYLLAWGLETADGTPEIYHHSMADEWAQIELYAWDHLEGCMYLLGPLNEGSESTYGPTEAWNTFKSVLREVLIESAEPPVCEFANSLPNSLEI
jgi:hypothetical protein